VPQASVSARFSFIPKPAATRCWGKAFGFERIFHPSIYGGNHGFHSDRAAAFEIVAPFDPIGYNWLSSGSGSNNIEMTGQEHRPGFPIPSLFDREVFGKVARMAGYFPSK